MNDIERMKLYNRAFAILDKIDELLIQAGLKHEAAVGEKKAA